MATIEAEVVERPQTIPYRIINNFATILLQLLDLLIKRAPSYIVHLAVQWVSLAVDTILSELTTKDDIVFRCVRVIWNREVV